MRKPRFKSGASRVRAARGSRADPRATRPGTFQEARAGYDHGAPESIASSRVLGGRLHPHFEDEGLRGRAEWSGCPDREIGNRPRELLVGIDRLGAGDADLQLGSRRPLDRDLEGDDGADSHLARLGVACDLEVEREAARRCRLRYGCSDTEDHQGQKPQDRRHQDQVSTDDRSSEHSPSGIVDTSCEVLPGGSELNLTRITIL